MYKKFFMFKNTFHRHTCISGTKRVISHTEMKKEEEVTMLQIGNALVSLDLIEQFFCCDLDKCLGECCIEGDAGAPITKEEYAKIKEILPEVWDDLLPAAKRVIEEQGVGYVDEEGDLVTSIVDGRNCLRAMARTGCVSAPSRRHTVLEKSTSTSQSHAISTLPAFRNFPTSPPSTTIVGKSANARK